MCLLQLIGIILLFAFVVMLLWEGIFEYWWVGGLLALFMFDNAFGKYKDSKLTDEQWKAKYPNETERGDSKGSIVLFTVVGLIFCVMAYSPFYFQAQAEKRDIERISRLSVEEQEIFNEQFKEHMQGSNPNEASARRQALEEMDKILLAKAEAEQKAREEAEENRKNIERVNQLSDVNMDYFNERFQAYLNNAMDENSARKKALADVDTKIAEEEKEKQRLAEWGDKVQVKDYLESIQPFALVNYLEHKLKNGGIDSLKNYANIMQTLAQSQQNKQGEASNQVAIYFACEAELELFTKKEDSLDSFIETSRKREAAQEKIREMAAWCGADLSSHVDHEILRQIEQNALEEERRKVAEAEAKRKAEAEEKARLAAEKAAREEEQKVAAWGDKPQLKRYLEGIQPFALTNFIKNRSGITGPLANGEIKDLQNHAFAMQALAQSQQNKPNEASRQVAIYFDCESELASHYASLKKGGIGLISGAQLPGTYSRQNEAEKKIREMAAWCGADLSDFAEEEIVKRIYNRLVNSR